ncbi:MAG: hypothetical protein U7126_14535 [Microcoleus sp.]
MHSRWLRESSTTQTVLITPRLVSEVNLSAAAIRPCLNYFTRIGRVCARGRSGFPDIETNLKILELRSTCEIHYS